MTIRIVSADEVGDLRALESLARRIFGAKDRPDGWFERKLSRDCVDPALSQIAVEGDPRDPKAWRGYLLVGNPPSMGSIARTAGTGVVEEMRGNGVGARLVEAAVRAVGQRGLDAIRLPTTDDLVGFYVQQEFEPIGTELTLLSFGRGPGPLTWGSEAPWHARSQRPIARWLAESWERTVPDQRACTHLRAGRARVRALVTREGCARVVRQLTLDGRGSNTDVSTAIDHLRDDVEEGAPLLLLGMAPRVQATQRLLQHGWTVAQRVRWMQRDLRVEAPAML